MSKVTVKLNGEGVRELLKSAEMQEICKEQAKIIQDRCGSGYESDTFVGQKRCNAMVYASTNQAIRDCRKNNTLLKAVR